MRRSSRLAAQAKAAEEAPPALAPEAPARPPKTSRARKPKVPVPAVSVEEAADEALEIKSEVEEIKFQAEEIKQLSSDQPSSEEEEEEEEEYDPEEDVAPIRKAPRRKPRGGASTSAPRQSRPAPSSRPVTTNVQESGMSAQINYDMEALAEEGTVNLNGRITVTRAKNEYLLTDRDIADLEFIKRKNPHHPDAHPMRLFLVREIVKTSYMKHGGAAGLEAAREMKELRKAGRGREY